MNNVNENTSAIKKATLEYLLIQAMDNLDQVIRFAPDELFENEYGIIVSTLFGGNTVLFGRFDCGADAYYNIPDDDPAINRIMDIADDIAEEIKTDVGRDVFANQEHGHIVYVSPD